MKEVIMHYDMLIDENNDPARDPEPLRKYMDKWDGQRFIDAMELDMTKSVLEIGVGTGRLALKVAPLCKSLLGIDISPKTVKRAKENLSNYDNVSLAVCDIIDLESDVSFDVIYSSLTFMHVKEKKKAIEKTASVLADNGIFVLSLDKSRDEFIDMGSRRIKIYPDDPNEMRALIIGAGMTVTDTFETESAYVIVSRR